MVPAKITRRPQNTFRLGNRRVYHQNVAVATEVSGERELSLSLGDLRERAAVTRAVTMECAGNGRARLEPHVVSQPWLLEAVGTAEWTGVPVRDVLEEAGVPASAVEVLFTGLDRGVEGGVEQAYQRSLTIGEA